MGESLAAIAPGPVNPAVGSWQLPPPPDAPQFRKPELLALVYNSAI